MADETSDFMRRGRARARNRFLLAAVLLTFTLGGVIWRGAALLSRMSKQDVEHLRVSVDAAGQASWNGRTYQKAEVDRLLADIAAAHPGAQVLVCAPDVRNPTVAALSLRSIAHGLNASVLADREALCGR